LVKIAQNIGNFTLRLKYVYVVESSAKYSVAQKQTKEKLNLRFHGKT